MTAHPRSESPPTALVVGAGLAGLAAATRLQAGGWSVRVCDAMPPGGKARTIDAGPGWRVEWGPHTFLHRADALWAFAAELGVADRAVPVGAVARARYLVRNGRLAKAPLGALDLGQWWSLARGLFRRVPDVPGESVYAWVTRRFGRAFADGPVDAMMTGIWASDPDQIEMDTAFPTVSGLVRAHGSVFAALRAARRAPKGPRPAGTYAFPEGMGVLAASAMHRLGADALFRAQVDSVVRRPGGWAVRAGGEELGADVVVLATEAPAAAALLEPTAPESAAALREIRYAPLAVAHWLALDSALPRGFGWLSAHRDARPLLGTIFASDLFPERAPPGTRAFTTMFGGARRPDDATIDVAEATRRIEEEHLALTGARPRLGGVHVVHHPAAVAPPAPGHAARIQRVRGGLPGGLAVAGAWCGAGAMDDAVRAGFDAAAAIGSPEGVVARRVAAAGARGAGEQDVR
jgi:oxygen-dependent protoporphyrinogen oxidase